MNRPAEELNGTDTIGGADPAHDPTSHPVRWVVLALLTTSIAINFIDRQTFSVLGPMLQGRYGLTNTDYSIMVFCFVLGMAVMQIPIGMLLDGLGPRKTFGIIVIGWSVVAAAHAWASRVWQYSALRFLLGNFECGNYSGGMKVISHWFGPRERALAGGIFNAGTLIGPVVAPPLVVWLALRYSYREAFIVPSALGLVWLVFWLRLYPKAGLATPGSSTVTGEDISVRTLLRYRQTWGVVLIRAFSGPFSDFYWYWLPAFLYHRGLSLKMIGLLAWIPYLGGALGNVGGGWFAGRLLSRGWSLDATRKFCFVVGGVLAAASALIPFVTHAPTAIAMICVSIFGSNVIEANYIGVITDVFPGSVIGRLTGTTGVADNIMSMALMLVTGIVIDRFSYLPVFIAVGVIPICEVLALFVGVGKVRKLQLIGASE